MRRGLISLLTVVFLAAGLASCDKKNAPPVVEEDESSNIFFAEKSVTHIIDPEQTSFDMLILRDAPDGKSTTNHNAMPQQTVDISASCSESSVLDRIITIPSQVSFDEGAKSTVLTVSYRPSKMQGNHNYSIVLSLYPDSSSENSSSQMTLDVIKEYYSDWAPFVVGTSSGMRNGQGTYNFSVYNQEIKNPVRVMSRYVPTYPSDIQFEFQWLSESEGWETFMTASSKNGGKEITVAPQIFASDPTYGDVTVADTYTYYGKDRYKGLTTFDAETGIFTLNLIYYADSKIFGNGEESLLLDGYTDTNVYELRVAAIGQDKIEEKDCEIVSFSFNECVDYVDYTVVNGNLEAKEVDAVVKKMIGTTQSEYIISTIDHPQEVALAISSTDDYTVVAVGYHKADDGFIKAVCSDYVSFFFKVYNPYKGWTTVSKDAVFTDHLVSWLFGDGLSPCQLTVQVDKSDEFEELYRITNPYAEFADKITVADFGYIEFEVLDKNRVNFPVSNTGIIYYEVPVEITSYANYYLMNGYSADEIPESYWGTFKDNVISLNAIDKEQESSFVLILGEEAFYLDIDFTLDMKETKISAKQRAKNLSNIIRRQMMPIQQNVLPSKAFYKAL